MPDEGRDDQRPLVVVLHGFGGDASHAFRLLELDRHVGAAGVTLASVDGGDYYWHARRVGVDPGAMVVDDLVPTLRRLTGYQGKVSFLGWSMGGYGSLLLAWELGPDKVGAVVAESAALWTEPGAQCARRLRRPGGLPGPRRVHPDPGSVADPHPARLRTLRPVRRRQPRLREGPALGPPHGRRRRSHGDLLARPRQSTWSGSSTRCRGFSMTPAASRLPDSRAQ